MNTLKGIIVGILIASLMVFLLTEPLTWKIASLELTIRELKEDKLYLKKIIKDRNKHISELRRRFSNYTQQMDKELTELGKWTQNDTLITH